MKGSPAGPPTRSAPSLPGRSPLLPSDPLWGQPPVCWTRARARRLHDGVAWQPPGRIALALLRERLQAAYAAEGLPCSLDAEGDVLRAPRGQWPAAIRALRALQTACGWTTTVEQLRGPGAPACELADVETPRLAPGWELVLHAETAGSRWETGSLVPDGEFLVGSLCALAPTLLRLADQGPWPSWLAPTQVAVLPLGADHAPQATELCAALRRDGLRAELHAEGTLGRRVREAARLGVPGVAVLGAAERRTRTVALRWRGGEPRSLARSGFSARLRALIDTHAPSGASLNWSPQHAASLADGLKPVAEPSTGVLSH